MIHQRHEDVASIAPDHDIFDFVEKWHAVQRQMRLDAAPMRLCVQLRLDFFERCHAEVEPWHQLHDGLGQVAVRKQHVGDYGLRQSRSGLVRCRDNDIVGTRLETIPAPRVHMVVLIDVANAWFF